MNLSNGTTTTPFHTVPATTKFLLSTTPPPFPSSERILLGVVLAISGNMLISVAMNIQKYSHNQLIESNKSYLKSSTWWTGILLMVLGEVGNFSAYGFAPASLVAPLGTTTVIANAVIAVVFLKEKIRYRDVLGILLALIGAFLLINFSNKTDTMLNAHEIIHNIKQWSFLVYLILEVMLFVLVLYLHHNFNYGKVITILLQVAVLGSLTVIAAKAVSSMLSLTFRGYNQLIYPIFYIMLVIMIVTAVGQIKCLNEAMALFDTTVVVPTNFVFFTMSAIISGIIFYREFYGLMFLEIFMFLFGYYLVLMTDMQRAFLSFGGVYLITGGRKEQDRATTSDEAEELLSSSSLLLSTAGNVQRVQPEGGDTDSFDVNSRRK